MSAEIFVSCSRATGDMAGVFEHDGDVGVFYLYHTERNEGERVVGSIHVLSGDPDFGESDTLVQWSQDEALVGLFIRGTLWAVFDVAQNKKYGGNYKRGEKASVPGEVNKKFSGNG